MCHRLLNTLGKGSGDSGMSTFGDGSGSGVADTGLGITGWAAIGVGAGAGVGISLGSGSSGASSVSSEDDESSASDSLFSSKWPMKSGGGLESSSDESRSLSSGAAAELCKKHKMRHGLAVSRAMARARSRVCLPNGSHVTRSVWGECF